jgi:hypothetical protein
MNEFKPIDEEAALLAKYKDMLPICVNPHPKHKKSCREMYATPLAWCHQCVNANKLLDVLANHESLKKAVLGYFEGEPYLGENAKLDQRTAIQYYATHEP